MYCSGVDREGLPSPLEETTSLLSPEGSPYGSNGVCESTTVKPRRRLECRLIISTYPKGQAQGHPTGLTSSTEGAGGGVISRLPLGVATGRVVPLRE